MQRPIRNRTMLSTKDHSYDTSSSTTNDNLNLNYCLLADSKTYQSVDNPPVDHNKEKIEQLLTEYHQLQHRIYDVKNRLQHLGFEFKH